VLQLQSKAEHQLSDGFDDTHVLQGQIAVLVEQKFDLFVVRALEREQVSRYFNHLYIATASTCISLQLIICIPYTHTLQCATYS
jgi:hypothetical protein